MKRRCLAMVIAGVCLPLAAHAQHDEIFPSDPRVVEANALLDDESQWERAIGLYRAVLADAPDDVDARVWLARVLAWKGDYAESLVQYDVLLGSLPPPPGLDVERIEVVSWSGRYDDAQAAFEEVLHEDPENARAWLGLARVHKWAGRRSSAYGAYLEALAISDDHETQHELEELLATLEWFTQAETEYFNDSTGFELLRTGVRAGIDFDFDTQIVTRMGYLSARRGDAFYAPQGTARRENAFEFTASVQRLFGEALRVRIEAGARIWNHAETVPIVFGEIEYSFETDTAVGFSVGYQDLLDLSYSIEAVLADIRATNLRAWVSQGISEQISSFAYVAGSLVTAPDPDFRSGTTCFDDPVLFCNEIYETSNGRVAAGASGSWAPWPERPLSFSVSVDYLHFSDSSIYYFAPQHDFSGTVGVSGSVPVYRFVRFEYEARIGGGFTREFDVGNSGLVYSVAGGPTAEYQKWSFSMYGFTGQTRRSEAYTSWGLGLNLGKAF